MARRLDSNWLVFRLGVGLVLALGICRSEVGGMVVMWLPSFCWRRENDGAEAGLGLVTIPGLQATIRWVAVQETATSTMPPEGLSDVFRLPLSIARNRWKC